MRRKIAVITPFIAQGGIERVAVIKAEELRASYETTLIVMDNFEEGYKYNGQRLDLNVSLLNRNIVSRFYNTIRAIYKLYKIKKKNQYDLVISHGELANIPNVFSGGKNNIVTIHSNRFAFKNDAQQKFISYIIKYIYSFKNVSKIVTVSKGIRDSYISKFHIPPKRIVAIYNPINYKGITSSCNKEMVGYKDIFQDNVIVTMGRLSFAKGQWYLLRIFKKLKERFPKLKLILLGEGEMKEKLVMYSKKLGMLTYDSKENIILNGSFDVYFLGFKKNPFMYIKKSKLFVMTSLWEGFGNTLVEAMACGVPVVSTACYSGPSEIINPKLENANQIKIPNYEGFGVLMPKFKKKFITSDVRFSHLEDEWVNSLEQLLLDKQILKKYKLLGINRSKDFQINPILNEWKVLIDSVLVDE